MCSNFVTAKLNQRMVATWWLREWLKTKLKIAFLWKSCCNCFFCFPEQMNAQSILFSFLTIFFYISNSNVYARSQFWRVRNMRFMPKWLILNIQTRSMKQRGEPEQSESASKSFSPVPFSAWLSNCVDGHAKFRKLKLSRGFFSPGVQLKAEDRMDRKPRGRHDIPLDEMSF